MDSDSGKTSPPESLLSRRKQAIIARSMAEIERQLDKWLDNDVLKPGKRAVKRARDDSDSAVDDHDYERGAKSSQKRAKHELIRFACPFAKHDPVKFKNVKTCCGPGWADPHRVKEHVYRRHSLKNACNRCFESFDDPKGLKEHQRSKTPCRLRDDAPTHVISDEQEEQLRARAKPNSSPTDKWQDMYRIIFPGAKVPSPYYDATDEEAIAKAESQSRFKDFEEYKSFFKREVLRTVKPVLEAELEKLLQTASATLKQTANTLIRDLHGRIVRTWQFQSEQSVREPTPEPTPEPEEEQNAALMYDFNQVIVGLQGDPMFPMLVPGDDFDLEALMGGAGQDHLDCGASVPDSAYFTSSLDDGVGSWAGGSYST